MTGSGVVGLDPANQAMSIARCHRLNINAVAKAYISASKEHGLAAGQELRPILVVFPFFEMTQRLRGASRVRHLQDGRTGSCWGEVDFPLAPPTGSERVRCICEGHSRSPVHGYLLQLSVGEETDPLAVRREERVAGSIRARDGSGLLAIHWSQINLAGSASDGGIGKLFSIGRESERRLARPH